jgi:2-dehydropantoate 2-reductase
MRITILGAGATGGHLAYRLAESGHDVSVVARGPHLAAIRAQGLGFTEGGATAYREIAATDDPAQLGPQDAVIVTVKATGLAAMPPLLEPIVGPGTLVYFPQNGMPWWYPVSVGELPFALPDLPIFRLGPAFARRLRVGQIAGGTLYSGNEVREPGVVFNSSPGRNSLTIAAIDPAGAEAVEALRSAIDASGVGATTPDDLRTTMWTKLVQNMSGSAIALATRNRTSISRQDPRLGALYVRIVDEGKAVAAAWGHPVALDPAVMLARAPHHRPSLLQDYEQGRPMEIGEIVLAPAAFARAAGIDCPSLDAVAAIVARLAIDKGLFSE